MRPAFETGRVVPAQAGVIPYPRIDKIERMGCSRASGGDPFSPG